MTAAAAAPPAAGLSLRTQELTAAFLLVRLFCSFMMEYDIHTLLDALTLAATGAQPPAAAGCWPLLLLLDAGRCCCFSMLSPAAACGAPRTLQLV